VDAAAAAAAVVVVDESVVSRMGMVPTGHAPNSKANRCDASSDPSPCAVEFPGLGNIDGCSCMHTYMVAANHQTTSSCYI